MGALENGLEVLKKIRRLEGLALLRGGSYAYRDLPFPETQEEEVRQEVIGFFQEYANEGRLAKKVVLGFEGLTLMLINERTIILMMLFADSTETSMVERSGELFLERFAEELDLPVIKHEKTAKVDLKLVPDLRKDWPRFRAELESLLTKVVGSGQAAPMIDRQLAERGGAEGDALPADQFVTFGEEVLTQIRDKSLRSLLSLELDYLLKDYSSNL